MQNWYRVNHHHQPKDVIVGYRPQKIHQNKRSLKRPVLLCSRLTDSHNLHQIQENGNTLKQSVYQLNELCTIWFNCIIRISKMNQLFRSTRLGNIIRGVFQCLLIFPLLLAICRFSTYFVSFSFLLILPYDFLLLLCFLLNIPFKCSVTLWITRCI